MKDRADFARKGIARGRSVVVLGYDDGIAFATETCRVRCTRSRRSTTASRSPRSASTTSSRTCASQACATRTCAATRTTVATCRRVGSRTPTRRRSAPSSRPSRSRSRSRSSSPRWGTRPRPTRSTGFPTTDRSRTSTTTSSWVVTPRSLAEAVAAAWRPAMTLAEVTRLAASVLAKGDDRDQVAATQLEVAVLDRRRPRRAFRRVLAAEPRLAHRGGRMMTDAQHPPDLRPRDRVRSHVRDDGRRPADGRRGRPAPLPQGRGVGTFV